MKETTGKQKTKSKHLPNMTRKMGEKLLISLAYAHEFNNFFTICRSQVVKKDIGNFKILRKKSLSSFLILKFKKMTLLFNI